MNVLRVACLLASLVAMALVTLPGGGARAAERRAFDDIRLEAMALDTQSSPEGAPPSHMALTWWIPHEYWQVAFANDGSTDPVTRERLLGSLRGVSLLAVVQAEIGEYGNFQFYDEARVRSGLKITRVDARGTLELTPVTEVDPALAPFLGIVKPLLSAAMGNLGTNMHFFVLDDRAPGGGRVVDPYGDGALAIELRTNGGARLSARIETPVNALFVPRLCANGKPAHVSWKFCPWDGKPLD